METLFFNPTTTTLLPHHPLSSIHVISHVRPASVHVLPRGNTKVRSVRGGGGLSYKSSKKVSRGGIVVCKGGVREINETEFGDVVLKSESPVLVEFVANWCGPCRLISPAVESLAQEYKEKLTIVKIDHDSNPSLIEEFKVYGLPTLILFKNGKEVPESRREGAITKVKLKAYVDSLLDSVSVS